MGDGDQNGGDQNGLEELNRAEQSWSGSKNQNISKLKKYQENVND